MIQWALMFRTESSLRVDVAYLWVNRMIGDAHIPIPDFQTEWPPKWIPEDKPNPTGRHTYWTARRMWKTDDPLSPSGLVGPARITSLFTVPLVEARER
jgi:hypothetical protein